MAESIKLFLAICEAEYFSLQGWTLIDPARVFDLPDGHLRPAPRGSTRAFHSSCETIPNVGLLLVEMCSCVRNPALGILLGRDGADVSDNLLPTFAHVRERRLVLRQHEAGVDKAKARAVFNPGKAERDDRLQP
jgi:hypothetical protein